MMQDAVQGKTLVISVVAQITKRALMTAHEIAADACNGSAAYPAKGRDAGICKIEIYKRLKYAARQNEARPGCRYWTVS